MANVYPPSPALSACDSLADIDDLDAFLDAQGKLSHWPTPPSVETAKKVTPVSAEPAEVDYDDEDFDEELSRLAAAFTGAATGHTVVTDYDTEYVAKVLLRAQVSVEVLAFAYNIIRAVGGTVERQGHEVRYLTPDLAVTACLSLATSFMQDKAPTARDWALDVCKGLWPAQHIDRTVIELLLHPNLRIHTLSTEEAIETALVELYEVARGRVLQDDAVTVENTAALESEPVNPLKLLISNTAQWVNGAVTPAETPIVEAKPFLPLL